MWLLTMTATRLVVFGLNAISGGLLVYLLATALFGADDWTGGFIGLTTAITITLFLIRRFDVFSHDLDAYRRLREKQENLKGN